jgi:hypothetical protein
MGSRKLARSILSRQERKLLLETRDILVELLETEEVLRDKALMRSIRGSQEDVKMGRLYTIEQLKAHSCSLSLSDGLFHVGRQVNVFRKQPGIERAVKP